MQLKGYPVEGGTAVTCPSKCAQVTVVPQGLVEKLPKNFAVLGIIQDVRERSSSLVIGNNRGRSPSLQSQELLSDSTSNLMVNNSSSSSNAEDYKCDVCEIRMATIVCPSCAVFLCVSCSSDIHSRKGYDLHQLVPVKEFTAESCMSSNFTQRLNSSESDLSGAERTCKQHASELTEYACETCCEEICKVCVISGEHKDHESRLLVDIATDKKEALRQAVEEIEDCHSTWNNGFDECHELQEYLYDRSRTMETEIKTRFHAIHSLLHAKEESFLSQVREEVETRVQSLKKQAE